MATCTNCGRRNDAPTRTDTHDGNCWAAYTLKVSDKLDCERAAHARTRAELAAARDDATRAHDAHGKTVRAVGRIFGLDGAILMDPVRFLAALQVIAEFAALAAARKETP